MIGGSNNLYLIEEERRKVGKVEHILFWVNKMLVEF
jgi:hypothetical protein